MLIFLISTVLIDLWYVYSFFLLYLYLCDYHQVWVISSILNSERNTKQDMDYNLIEDQK